MLFRSDLTRPLGLKTIVSLNPIMIDGTGMCGGCRVTVNGANKFACVDGPEFDAAAIAWDEVVRRLGRYRVFEERARTGTGRAIGRLRLGHSRRRSAIRADEIHPHPDPARLLQTAPETADGYIVVPEIPHQDLK